MIFGCSSKQQSKLLSVFPREMSSLKKLRVEFSLEDMDTDGFKKGATYIAIRDWIKDKYGYRVTNRKL